MKGAASNIENRPSTAPTEFVSGGELKRRREAFTKILSEQETALLRAARRLCGGNEDQAQDLVQDAAIKAYSAFIAGRFQEGTHARAWLLRILTNLYINEYHQRQRRQDPADIGTLTADGVITPASLRANESEQPEKALFASALSEPVETAIAKLSAELRVCIELVDIGELDYAEAAGALNIPIGTVRSRLFRGRQQLHRLLKEYASHHRLEGGRDG